MDSRWSPAQGVLGNYRDSTWIPHGLHQDSRYILAVSQASQNLPGVLVESLWSPAGVPGVLGSPHGTCGAV